MKSIFSKSWRSSKQPRKQRKYLANAPLHLKGRLLAVHLSKDLREKYGVRSIRVRRNDKVKVVRGSFKGTEGKVESVDVKHCEVYVSKVEVSKKDGSKAKKPLHPSNLIITELNLDDKKRLAKLKKQGAKEKSAEPGAAVEESKQAEKPAKKNAGKGGKE